MDPISIGLGVVGFGMQIFGGLSAAEHSREQAEISQKISAEERKVNEQKRLQMQLSARRQQTEIFRNMQRARAQGQNAATQQGASLGSGLQGGLAQVAAQSFFNAQGINQNLEIGENIFSLNNNISGLRAQSSQVQSDAATDQGIASLGGSIVKAGPIIGAFGRNIGSYGSGSSGNYSGMPGASNTGGLY